MNGTELGPLVVVTDRRQTEAAGRELPDVVEAAVDAGAHTVLLREKDLDSGLRLKLAEAVGSRLRAVDGTLLVSTDAGMARAARARGVHLAAGDPWPPITTVGTERLLVGRSCHSLDELRAAVDEGVDYATLSPVWATMSKPGYGPALGVDALAEACATLPDLPIYALGGLNAARAGECRAAGAAGVAMMGGIMRVDDPASVVRAVLQEWT